MGGSYYSFPCSILSTGKDCKTPQRYPDVPTTSWRISLRSMDMFQGLTLKRPSSWHRPLAPSLIFLTMSIPSQDEPSINRPVSLPHVRSAVVPTTLSIAWKIPNKPLFNTHPCVPMKRKIGINFRQSQDTRLSKFKADFKQQQSEMTNKIDIVLKPVTDRIVGALPSDTIKNRKLSTSLVLSARSYTTEVPRCSTHIYGSINAVTNYPKQQSESHDDKPEEKEKDDPDKTNTVERMNKQRDKLQPEPNDPTAIDKIGPIRGNEEIKWLDVEEPLNLVDTSEESVYESLIREIPKCSLSLRFDFRIEKGDPRNLKIPYMIGHKFTANAYIDIDLPMNIMSLAYYNSI
ncbi:hypothetical protein Tco_1016215 [Tanacetum coccineum]|uniref:Uncharacterized protein n=1 Tax=Tanacetum coccineum TaxID=301880 RepID=A0ABQ5FN66_9ASTR